MDIDKKPKLPSIEFMLQGLRAEAAVNLDEPQRWLGHRRQASDLYPTTEKASRSSLGGSYQEMFVVGGLPSRVQKLAISKLAAVKPYPVKAPLMFPPHSAPSSSSTSAIPTLHHLDLQQQRPSNKVTHARSYSDYTHPYPHPSSSSSSSSSALPNYLQPGTYSHHRRAISTDSLDFIIQRQQRQQHHHHHSAFHSATPATATATSVSSAVVSSNPTTLENDTTASSKSPAMSEDTESEHSESLSDRHSKQVDGGSGNRYCCPYCDKRFTRPSSLRIHTYSHTGEKPFVCTEPGCAKRFSVHSNMRRHLRVHRTIKTSKRSTPVQIRPLESTNNNSHQQYLNENTSNHPQLSYPYKFSTAQR